MNAVILSIGSEIVQGFLSDTNSTHLARELNLVGVEVVGVFQVGDDLGRLTLALNRSMDDADLIVCTGGIGPTADDLTREAIAKVCGEQPEVDPLALETVRSFFRRRGSEMPEQNAKQAWIIPSAEILPNPNGTAPGWFVRYAGKVFVAMPGVPREMMPMWEREAVPRLMPLLPANSIQVQTLKTIGLGESLVEKMLAHIIERGYPTVSTYAKNDGVHVRIVAASPVRESSSLALSAAESEVRAILGQSVYGDLETSLPHALLNPLAERGFVIDIWESGTSGQVVSLLMSDESVAHAIGEVRVSGVNEPNSRRSVAADPLHEARRGLAQIRNTPVGRLRLGVAVTLVSCDPMGRCDARVGIVVESPIGESTFEHMLAAKRIEIGRRASLLAADALRQVDLAAITDHPR